LRLIGKKRGVKLPLEAYHDHGPYVYAKAVKESFWKALIRPSKNNLPDDLFDIFELSDNFIGESNKSKS
jgi:hypothetical protein